MRAHRASDARIGAPFDMKHWLAALAAVPAAFAVLSIGESLRVPSSAYAERPGLWLGVVGHCFVSGSKPLTWPLLFPLLVAAALAMPDRWRRWRVRELGLATVGVVAAVHVYFVLTKYPQFRGYLPFVAAHVALGAFLAYGYLTLAPGGSFGRSLRARFAVAAVAAAGAAAAHAADRAVFPGAYPTLHLALAQVALLLLALAFAHALGLLASFQRAARAAALGAVALPSGLAVGAALLPSGDHTDARPLFATFTTLGQSRVVWHSYDPSVERVGAMPVPDDPRGVERFLAHANLPRLPESFRLDAHHVLLVTIEALRFDQTTLARGGPPTTPSLAALARRGAFVFERAFAPSSGTFHSMSAILTMTYPSHAPLETWSKPWHGALGDAATTAAELFATSGYSTFWVGHNFVGCFDDRMLGLGQGFGRRELVWSEDDAVATDRAIIDRALGVIDDQLRRPRRLFGWVFLESPHAHYVPHYDDWPASTDLERYRQEVRFADEQLGRLFAELERRRVLRDTIVVVTGDHGEEFGEHGGTHHKRTVYSESVHVPLVVWLPAVQGRRIAEPTSTLYVLPWLMLHGGGGLRAAAEGRLRRHIGPMLRETDGAVVVELVGHDRMQTALVYDGHKLNYDFVADRLELFDTSRDPGEQTDLVLTQSEVVERFAPRLAGYRRARAANLEMTSRPDRLSPEVR